MNKARPRSYEFTIVSLLALLWGILILNRFSIMYLFPFIIDEFKITYAQAGALTSILALTFAFSTWFSGGLSDRFGRKIILIPTTIFFSITSWFSGLAQGLVQMFFARALMGIGQGAVLPASIATILMESTPSRRGFNFGLQQALAPLIAGGIGPILVTQLTRVMSWREVFFVIGIPGIVIAVILYFYMREPLPMAPPQGGEDITAHRPGFFTPLKYRNVLVSSIVTPLMLCANMVFMTFCAVYLTKEMKLSIGDAGLIISLFGFTAFGGSLLVPLLSDYLGRKTVVIPSLFIMGLCYFGFLSSGSQVLLLAVSVSVAGFLTGGTGPLILSALVVENVPPELAGTASGIPISFGEIFGGAMMPFLAGYLSDAYGLKIAIYFAALSPIIAGCVSFLYRETAPRVLERRAASTLNVPA
jgi:predicted MFS family arabinose efflux permease